MIGVLGVLLRFLIVVRYLLTSHPSPHSHLLSVLVGASSRILKRKHPCESVRLRKNLAQLTCTLLFCRDIQSNTGRTDKAHIYSCGLCEQPVTWEHVDGLCYDGCYIWNHRSCIKLCSVDYDLLTKHSHIQWLCFKCESINVRKFTFQSFELSTSNMYQPLANIDSSKDSLSTEAVFSPLYTSSPARKTTSFRSRRSHSSVSKTDSLTNASSLFCVSEKKYLRIMNINCRSIGGKSSEFLTALITLNQI